MKLPLQHFENVRQLASLTTAVLDDGPQRSSRVAFINTGQSLRYTIALDRGADIIDATSHQHALAYLTQNNIAAPSHAFNQFSEWHAGWPAGLCTTCGPSFIGHDRVEDDQHTGLHGHHANTPAQVTAILHPDPWQGQMQMGIDAIISDTRNFGPNLHVHRSIRSTIGDDAITITDRTVNRDPFPNPHALMYHCNIGWPLLDEGARLILSGRVELWPEAMQRAPQPKTLEDWKIVPAPSRSFIRRSRGFICTPKADDRGVAHVGIINPRLELALELSFKLRQIPRVMIWQHYAPGMYVCGIEPMYGSPFPTGVEPRHNRSLKPGESRPTQLTLRVHRDPGAIRTFARHDGRLSLA